MSSSAFLCSEFTAKDEIKYVYLLFRKFLLTLLLRNEAQHSLVYTITEIINADAFSSLHFCNRLGIKKCNLDP